MPVITLERETTKEAVCLVFETVFRHNWDGIYPAQLFELEKYA